MLKLLKTFAEQKKINPPPWLLDNMVYITVMGSHSYGTNTPESDFDIYGCCIPKKELVFPHQLNGEIEGFGRQIKRFEQFQAPHIKDESRKTEYDFQIYGIVKYFQLCMDCNPNMIDSLFTSQECVTHCTQVGNIMRENRRLFLHKGAYYRFKGYSYAQLHKMTSKDPTGKRKEIREKYGFDVKFASHVVRLLNECEQILLNYDLDLRQNNEQLKAIRRGEVSEQEIRAWATEKEKYLERVYEESTIPHSPDEQKIKKVLIDCLEHHYGSLDKVIHMPDRYEVAIKEIETILERFR